MQQNVTFAGKFDKDAHYQRVRDHSHFTGKYRCAAHSVCNLRFKVPKEIPAVSNIKRNYKKR